MSNVSETRLGIDGKLSVEFSGGDSSIVDLSRAVAGVYDSTTDKVNLNSDTVKMLSTAVPTRSPKATNSGDWFVQEDQQLHVLAGSALDFTSFRTTAVPAGSKGQVTVSGDNLVENGSVVRFNVATWAPDSGFYWIPASNSEVTAALEHLVRSGYNALRIHGVENMLMSGMDGEWALNPSVLDRFDFVLSEAKRLGLYWIHNPMNWWLGMDMDGGTDRFAPSHADGGYKTRIYTHQNIRDHWLTGLNLIYNRVNKYTGTNIIKDPATLMVELFNETDISYLASVNNAANKFPVAFLTRDVGATAAAKTWSEWLADPAQLHGYSSISALNTSWGTAYADFESAGAAPIPSNSLSGSAPGTNLSVDIGMYSTYLDDDLSSFYSSVASSIGLTCLLSQYTTANFSLFAYRGISSQSTNSVANFHSYPILADAGLAVGSTLSKTNDPIWHSNNRAAISTGVWGVGGKPSWFGEYGWPSWAKYRSQFPVWIASLVQNNAAGVSFFCQGRFWEKNYKLLADATTAQRFGRTFPYAGHGDPVSHFTAVMVAILQQGNVITRQSSKNDFNINQRAFGWYSSAGSIVRTGGRAGRLHGGLYRPMVYAGLINRCNINYNQSITDTDDTYASTNLPKSWKQLQNDVLPVKNISGVLISGTYGGYTASATAPILTLSTPLYANTYTGDKIFITNLTGSGGTWPGTSQASTACPVTVIDSTHVQVTSGLTLTGTSGFTAGTYCEASEHFQSTNNNNGNILTVHTTGTVFGATASTTQPIIVLGANGGSSGTVSLVAGDEIYIVNLTGSGGTGNPWPATSLRNASLSIASVLDAASNTVQLNTLTGSQAFPTGLSGVTPSAGTWCEGLNIVEGRFREWGISSRKQRAWINTPKLVAFFHASATTFPVNYQNVTFSALSNDASIFVTSLDGLPLTTSKKILVGMVGDSQNSGMKFTDGTRKTIANGGEYPIQVVDNYSKFSIARTAYGNPKITPLGLSGTPLSKPSKLTVDSTNIYVEIQNSVADSIFWLIEI